MRLRGWIAGSAVASLALFACERRIGLGDFPQETGGTAGADGGDSGQPDDGSTFPDRLIFTAKFETADLSEWGIESVSLETAGGVFSADAQLSHTGRHSGKVLIDTLGEHVVVSRDFDEQELLVGMWLRLEETYSTGNWPFLHFDQIEGTGTTELWDLGFDASGGGEQRLFLWEKPLLAGTADGSRIADASLTFEVARWVHVQVHLLCKSDTTGFLRVYQDEILVLEEADRPTSQGTQIRLSFGSYISSIEPLPAVLWIDTVTVHAR